MQGALYLVYAAGNKMLTLNTPSLRDSSHSLTTIKCVMNMYTWYASLDNWQRGKKMLDNIVTENYLIYGLDDTQEICRSQMKSLFDLAIGQRHPNKLKVSTTLLVHAEATNEYTWLSIKMNELLMLL